MTSDDALLYAADSDLDTVFAIDTRSEQVVATIKVGHRPEKVLIAPDDLIYVTNRMSRSVSVIRRGESAELYRIPVAVEPVGLAISSDASTLYVVNSTSLADAEVGTLMAIDTQTRLVKWETPVGPEPRSVTLVGDGKAIVTLYKEGDIVMVNAKDGRIMKAGTDVVSQLNRTRHGAPDSFGSAPGISRPRALEAVTTSADGEQVHVVTLLSTETVLDTADATTPITSGTRSSGGYSGGSCGSTAVAAPAIVTFDSSGNALVDDVGTCTTDGAERPVMLLTSNVPGMPIQGPRAVVGDATGSFLFIANFESNNVAIVPTASRPTNSTFGQDFRPIPDRSQFGFGGSVRQLVAVGAGPTGIAVAHDGSKAWVYNAFDHSVSRLESVANRVANVSTKKLADDVLPPDVVAGRKMFFSAVDQRMNNPSSGISCGSCHLEGREDGHVWNFPEGPRQTPSLAGRMMSKTAPFHWGGEFSDLTQFMTLTVQGRMGGTGVTPVMERQVAAFVDAMEAPDNPHKNLPGDVLARGQAAFVKAECNSCHAGEAFTDNSFADVGTLVTQGPVLDRLDKLPHGGLNTPSLLGLARTAPFLHDGSASSLRARILQGKDLDLHGRTSVLNDAEVNDLVLYLKSL